MRQQDPVVVTTVERVQAPVQALTRLRSALTRQYSDLEADRNSIIRAASETSGERKRMFEARIDDATARMESLERQIAGVDEQLARLRASGIGETRVSVPPFERTQPTFPEEVLIVPVMFILCVGLPLSVAWARRIMRRGDAGSVSKEVLDRLTRMDQNIDAIALEVERIGENQRYLSKQIGPGPAERVDAVRAGEREPTRR